MCTLRVRTRIDKNEPTEPVQLTQEAACVYFTIAFMEEAEGKFLPDRIHVQTWKEGINADKLIETFDDDFPDTYSADPYDSTPAVEILEDMASKNGFFDVTKPLSGSRPKHFLPNMDNSAHIRQQ